MGFSSHSSLLPFLEALSTFAFRLRASARHSRTLKNTCRVGGFLKPPVSAVKVPCPPTPTPPHTLMCTHPRIHSLSRSQNDPSALGAGGVTARQEGEGAGGTDVGWRKLESINKKLKEASKPRSQKDGLLRVQCISVQFLPLECRSASH